MKVGVGLWGRDQVGHRPRPGSGSGRGNQTGVLVGPGTGAEAGVRMASCCPVCPPLAARGSASPPRPPCTPIQCQLRAGPLVSAASSIGPEPSFLNCAGDIVAGSPGKSWNEGPKLRTFSPSPRPGVQGRAELGLRGLSVTALVEDSGWGARESPPRGPERLLTFADGEAEAQRGLATVKFLPRAFIHSFGASGHPEILGYKTAFA